MPLEKCILMKRYFLTPNKSVGYNKEGIRISAKMHKLGGLLIVGRLMFNRQYGDLSISKLLQLVVNIVKYKRNSLF